MLCVLVSFVLQLITATKDGLVERISIASSGAFVVVLVTAVVLLWRAEPRDPRPATARPATARHAPWRRQASA